jgi:transcription antitermination factor NusA-like protein
MAQSKQTHEKKIIEQRNARIRMLENKLETLRVELIFSEYERRKVQYIINALVTSGVGPQPDDIPF